MTETTGTGLHVANIAMLKPGDHIEAKRNGVTHHRGRDDSVAPDLGIAWITEALPGNRRIIDTQEFTVWLTRP